jgi:hypothetical protein
MFKEEGNVNTSRKVDLLYKKAHGQGMDASAAEKRELGRYKVQSDDGNLATKANISAYVKAVDGGYPFSFYDWCMNNKKADRRRKGSSAGEMAAKNRSDSIGVMLIGWLFWGLAVYWVLNGAVSAGGCAVIGAIIAAVLYKCSRRYAGLTVVLLPIIIAVVAAGK